MDRAVWGSVSSGLSAWVALPVLAGALGIGAVAGSAVTGLQRGLVGCGVLLLVWASPLDLRHPVVPQTPLPPDPALDALDGLPAGSILLIPGPAWPFVCSTRTASEVLVRVAAAGRPLHLWEPIDPPLLAEASRFGDLAVALDAASLFWSTRNDPPLEGASNAGVTGILVDRSSVAPARLPMLHAWLDARLGPPVAEGPTWILYGVLSPRGG